MEGRAREPRSAGTRGAVAALGLHRDADAHGAAINRHFAEELVLVGQARRQFCLPEARAFRAEAQPVAIEVIAVRDSEPHLDVPRVCDAG